LDFVGFKQTLQFTSPITWDGVRCEMNLIKKAY